MAEGADIIVGSVLIDDLVYADGSQRPNVLGGAGLYALAGAALFSPAPLLVAGAGTDMTETFGPWMRRNRLTERGVRIVGEHTARNTLRYLDERTRTETPVFGHDHFRLLEPQLDDVARVIDGARGVYLFRNTDPAMWRGIASLRHEFGFCLLWEIALDACSPRERPRIEELSAIADAFSLNIEEAALIFGTADEDRLLAVLQALPVATVFLRAGARGSFALTRESVRFVPSLDVAAVDVTGGGNAYCGGALVGLAEGRSPLIAAAMGTVAASFTIGQFGPPEPGGPSIRTRACDHVTKLVSRVSEGAEH